MYKLSAIVLSLIVAAHAQYSSQRTGNQISTYDFKTGSYISSTVNPDGSISSYNFNTSSFTDYKPKANGDYEKYDYKKARYSDVPRDSVPGADKVKLKNKTMQFLFGD